MENNIIVNMDGGVGGSWKMDTQGMSLPGESDTNPEREYPPMPVKKRTIFTAEERIELKEIINEALDERNDARR
ncbi:hypothetical protein S-MbCM100_064 [Synechococcus phage S-MbCM100]|uniref:Uncharacterized protein n=1 Tax=Synechococcus phage S-MbCM100 TaxID=1340812 RepID=V5UUT8_9CAUD|nr:hypothetical protein S-MbCM100_064 [Synechococcus phage S-MbCM100]AHB80914.1 hypothetical protein S-MbCM100_064 [Synechococcus phage S-MbCM100]